MREIASDLLFILKVFVPELLNICGVASWPGRSEYDAICSNRGQLQG